MSDDELFYCPEDAYAVHVLHSETLLELQTAVQRPSSIARVLSYYQKVGSVRRLTKKIWSRQVGLGAERKVVRVGVGEILPDVGLADAPQGSFYGGERVLFLATRAEARATRLRISARLLLPFDRPLPAVAALLPRDEESWQLIVERLAGWSVYGGLPLPGKVRCQKLMKAIAALPGEARQERVTQRVRAPSGSSRPLPIDAPQALRAVSRWASSPPVSSRGREERGGRVVVFGLGHYARTCLLPNLERRYEIWRVHEIDEALRQQLSAMMPRVASSASPWPVPEDGDGASMWCLAGYHHHHARQVCEALDEQIDVMVEKPLVVSRQGLSAVLAALEESAARIYQGFHRRTWQPSGWLRKDLQIQRGSSVVHYHTVAHEVSLPPHHWYRWPSSGSRLVVNGCHWLDEFLFLNDYRPWTRAHATSMCDGEVWVVQVELDHGATFSMTLSSEGSDRLGVRETTSIHCGDRSARIVDNLYVSEDGERELRRATILEEQTYRLMIDAIASCQRDQRDKEGDGAAQIERLWELIFTLEASAARR